MFKGILIEKDEAGYRAAVREIDDAQLPDGDVTVRVSHSTLNYKDGLAITGKGPVVRRFPMVPGVDLVGTVEASSHSAYKPGDSVVLNGWGVGEVHWAAWRRKPASTVTGWYRYRCNSHRNRRWPSAPPVTPRCSASSPWNATV